MLLDAFLDIANQLMDWLIAQRPDWSPTPDPSVQTLIDQCQSWDWLFPIHELLIVFGLAISLFAAVVAFKWIVKIADWIADVIP